MELTDRLVVELIESVKQVLKRETSERLREVYLVGDIDKDSARQVIERMRELVNDNTRPITLYLNTAGRQRDGWPRRARLHPRDREPRLRGDDRRAGNGVLDGVGAAAGRERRAPPGVSPCVDNDPRAGEVGRLAIHDRSPAPPGSIAADAGSDLPDPGEALGPTAEADYPGHPPQRLLPRCAQGARIRSDRRDRGKCGRRRRDRPHRSPYATASVRTSRTPHAWPQPEKSRHRAPTTPTPVPPTAAPRRGGSRTAPARCTPGTPSRPG